MEALITVIFLVLVVLCWVFIFFGGFGTLLIFLFSFFYSLLTDFKIINSRVLLALFLIYITGEIFDYIFIFLGVKFSGASRKAGGGAIIGGLIGAALSLGTAGTAVLPLTLLGIFLGASLVELNQKKDILKALKAGIGSFLGRIGAVFFKAILGLLMVIILILHIISYLR